ncbi:MAG: DUF454 family protein [Planctomycetes bacterium]|nr:DUF454 family protein [Planctomycetota bacterium]
MDHSEIPDLLPPRSRRRSIPVRVAALAAGVILFAVGIAGWILPFMPGVPFLVASAAMFAVGSRTLAELINKIEKKLPERVRVQLRPRLKRQRQANRRVDTFFE